MSSAPDMMMLQMPFFLPFGEFVSGQLGVNLRFNRKKERQFHKEYRLS